MSQRYELRIEASGEVRDADGNVIEQIPVNKTIELSEEQVKALLEES